MMENAPSNSAFDCKQSLISTKNERVGEIRASCDTRNTRVPRDASLSPAVSFYSETGDCCLSYSALCISLGSSHLRLEFSERYIMVVDCI